MAEAPNPIRKVKKRLTSLPAISPAPQGAELSHWVQPVSASSAEGAFGFSPGEVQLREYWRVIAKYRYVILAAVGVCMALATLFSFLVTPRYTATALLRVSTYEPVLAATKIEDLLEQKSREANYLETQLEELRSNSLADRILSDPDIRARVENEAQSTWWTRVSGTVVKPKGSAWKEDPVAGYATPVKLIRAYLRSIEVRPIRKTSLIEIDATAADATLAAELANLHARHYIGWVRDMRIEQQSQGLAFLQGQEIELRQKVSQLDRELAEYAERHSIVAINANENVTAQRMSQLSQLLTQATADRIAADKAYHEAAAALSRSSAGADDSSAQQMRMELAKLEGEYMQLSAKFTDSYPKMQQLSSQIKGLKKAIAGQRIEIVAGLKSRASATAAEEVGLRSELDLQTAKTFELSKKQVEYNQLNRDLTSTRELLESVLKQRKETSLAVESNASNISMVDRASVPSIASYPKKKVVVFVGFLLGCMVGLGLAFLFQYLDNTIRTPEELVSLIKIPSLGVVPSFALEPTLMQVGNEPISDSGPRSKRRRSRLEKAIEAEVATTLPALESAKASLYPIVYLNYPQSLASEAYRTIRTGLLLSQAGEPPRTILITSAQSSEGKTTSSINLAASLASAGGKVVIIDADLRRPSLYTHFGLERDLPGLVEVLTGQRDLAEVCLDNLIKRVTVIPSGRIPPNPAELLSSNEMARLLAYLGEQFDYVLIDSPPILPVTDSVILSRYVDGVLLIVKGASTPRKVVTDACARLQAVGARVLGAVLNNVDVTSGDYYYYSRYYHSYYTTTRPEKSESEVIIQ